MWEEKIKPLLSKSEVAYVKTGPIDTFLRISRNDQDDAGKKPSITKVKEPDFSCGFCQPSKKKLSSPMPRTILETALTETSDELAVDVGEWFRSTNSVQLVFVVKISEARPTDDNSPGRTERIRSLVARFGKKTAMSESSDEGEDVASQSSVESGEAQDGIAKELVVNDWVGPLSAYCEAWERFGDRYRRRGGRVELLPNLVIQMAPLIKVLDVIPHDFIDARASKSRHTIPDFEELRQQIMAAKDFQAERRAWEYVRQ